MEHAPAARTTQPLPCSRAIGVWIAPACVAAILAVFFLIAGADARHVCVDDSYIFMRVVDNVLAGHGWCYNPADPATNPLSSALLPLLLLPIRALGVPPELTLILVYSTGILLLATFQYAAMRERGTITALIFALATAVSGIVIRSYGMETSVFLACIAASAWSYSRGHMLAAGLAAGATALARPEGLAMVAILAGLHLLERRKLPIAIVGACTAVVVPWLVFAHLTFGSIVPQSVAIKSIQSTIGIWAEQTPFLPHFLGQSNVPFLTFPLFAYGAFLVWRRLRGGEAYLAAVVGFGLVQTAAYSIGRAPAGYFWYFAASNLAVDTCVLFALLELVRRVRPGLLAGKKTVVAQIATVVVMVLVALQLTAKRGKHVQAYRLAAQYREAATWIDHNTPAHCRVACVEIGYLGYFSRRAILDVHGLIHREAFDLLRDGELTWWFRAPLPEVIVVHEPRWHGEPGHAAWPAQHRADIDTRYRSAWRADGIVVLVRKDVLPG